MPRLMATNTENTRNNHNDQVWVFKKRRFHVSFLFLYICTLYLFQK